jgi:hypothetical protein
MMTSGGPVTNFKLLAVFAALISSPALAVVEQARSADAFVESIGINTHYGNSIFIGGNAYANPAIDAKLAELGVRHIRDHSYNDAALAKIDLLHNTYGIKANLILGETTRSPAQLVNLLKAHPGYEAIEGLNEPDFNARSYGGFTDKQSGPNDYSATRAFQNDLFAAVNADPQTQHVSVLSPAMGTTANTQYLPPINFDVAAMHYYSDGREPTFGLDTRVNQMTSFRAGKPLMSTESGYFNQPAADVGGIPEHISGRYMPRMYAEYFNRGFERTYGYELADQGPNPANREENFGLLRFDLSEKPAFTAMKRMIDLVEEPGANFTPGSLDYVLSSNPATLHHTLLQKSNGTFYLMLWQEVAAYQRFSETELPISPLSINLDLLTDIAFAGVFQPNDSANPLATYVNPDSIPLSVTDRLMVIELTQVPEPGAIGMIGVALTTLIRRRRSA